MSHAIYQNVSKINKLFFLLLVFGLFFPQEFSGMLTVP